MKTNRYSGFHKLSIDERLKEVAEYCNLSEDEQKTLLSADSLTLDIADHMIENVIGRYALPLGIGMNLIMNGKEYLIPMVIEEPSVVAAMSNAARFARENGGFSASFTGPVMIGQIQVMGLSNPSYAGAKLFEHEEEIHEICDSIDPYLASHGGGFQKIEVRILDSKEGPMLILHLIVNTLDAMGANAINTMAERLAPKIEEWTGGKVYLRILSNLATYRMARASVTVKKESLGGEEIVDKLVTAYHFAEIDPWRAATHNKGIMNGITPVVMATGNDTRAIESGAHAFASLSGRYKSLTVWEKDANGNLCGTLEMPMAVGLVGGASKIHPTAKLAVKILGVESAAELAEVITCVGLSQNLAAIRVLATEGVQRGHMALHARNVATTVGAKGKILDKIVEQMIKDNKVNAEYAAQLLENLQGQ